LEQSIEYFIIGNDPENSHDLELNRFEDRLYCNTAFMIKLGDHKKD
jgi:hypothetical protein